MSWTDFEEVAVVGFWAAVTGAVVAIVGHFWSEILTVCGGTLVVSGFVIAVIRVVRAQRRVWTNDRFQRLYVAAMSLIPRRKN